MFIIWGKCEVAIIIDKDISISTILMLPGSQNGTETSQVSGLAVIQHVSVLLHVGVTSPEYIQLTPRRSDHLGLSMSLYESL